MFLDKFFKKEREYNIAFDVQEIEKYKEVQEIIDSDIKPFVHFHNGKIKFLGIKDNVIFVELKGSCSHCPAIELTLKGFIQRILKEKLSWVEKVEKV
jgi:Fe-S cluster biogenesis protein NfuA